MQEKSIRWVFIRSYLIIMSISLVIGSALIERINKERVQHKNYLEDTDTINRTTIFFDLIIEQIKEQSLEMVIDEEMQKHLGEQMIFDENEVVPILSRYLVKNDDLAAIYLINHYNNLVCASNLKYVDDKEAFFKQFNLSNIRQKAGDCYIGITSYPTDIPTIYIARSIRSKETGNILGYLFLFVDREYLEEKMISLLDKVDFEMIVVDDTGHVISFPDNCKLNKLYTAISTGKASDEEKEQWKDKYHHVRTRYSNLGATVIGQYVGERKDNTLQMVLLGVYVINMLFFIMAIFVIGRQVVYPLEKIASRADEIATTKNITTRFDENKGYKEVNSIGLALNKMLYRIQFLIKEAKERERIQKALELSMINYQVNPHFLYNTLNSASVLVAIEDKENAVELIKSLARYYRACLNREGELNTVAQEVEIAKEYLHIALLKNPNLFEVAYEVDESIMMCKMPRMVIQILVENAVKYGIRTMNEPLQIYVGVKNDPLYKRIIVEVRDNGKGIDAEIVEHIMKDEKLHSKSGFGLRSIIKRIGLIYNIEEVTNIIEIETIMGHHTKIKIYIPWEIYTDELLHQDDVIL